MNSGKAFLVAQVAAIVAACALLLAPPPANAALFVCLVAFLASGQARRNFAALLREPIGIATLVMVGSLALGLFYGDNALADGLGEFYLNRFWLLIPVFAALFVDDASKRRFALAYTLFCATAAVLSIAFWLADYAPRHNPPGILLRDHVTQGMALAVAAFVGVLLLAHERAAPGKPMRRTFVVVLVVAIACCVLDVLYVAIGRSGHVALLVLGAYLVVKYLRSGAQRKWALALALLMVVGVASSSMIRERFMLGVQEVGSIQESGYGTSMGFRVVFWRNTLELIKERPWLGQGTGGFDDAYARKVKGVDGWQGTPTWDPHNQYLMTLAERGALGLTALLAFLVLLCRQAKVGAPWRDVALGTILVWCITNLVNSHFHTFNQGHLFAMVVGCFLAPLRVQTAAAATSDRVVQ